MELLLDDTLTKDAPEMAWREFTPGPWKHVIDVRDLIQLNYTPYAGDAALLAPATECTLGLWEGLDDLDAAELVLLASSCSIPRRTGA